MLKTHMLGRSFWMFAFLVVIQSPLLSQVCSKADRIVLTDGGRVYEVLQGKRIVALPCSGMPTSLSIGKQVRYRNSIIWMTDGHRILSKVCGGGSAKLARLPDRVQAFSAFEVTEEGRLLIWGPTYADEKGVPILLRPGADWTLGLLVNPDTGKIDQEFAKFRVKPGMGFYDGIEASEVLTTMAAGQMVIAGKYSGRIHILEPDSGKAREIEVIAEADLPPKGKERVNHGESITQLVPLPWGELLIGLRIWTPGADGSEGWVDQFRVLNLSDFSLSEADLAYAGVRAGTGSIWVDWDRKPHFLAKIESEVEAEIEAEERLDAEHNSARKGDHLSSNGVQGQRHPR